MKKILLSFFMLLVASLGSALADIIQKTVTFELTTGYKNEDVVTTVSKENVNLLFGGGLNTSSIPKWYNTGTALRMYANNTLEISYDGKATIKSVEFSFSSSSNNFHRKTGKQVTLSTGNYTEDETTGTWNDLSENPKLIAVDATGHARIKSIVVVLEIEEIGGTEETVPQAPTFDIIGGDFYNNQKVIITAQDESKIYYTLDGQDPNKDSNEFSEFVLIDKSCTLKAVAVKGELSSTIATAEFKILTAKPVFSIAEGSYSESQKLEITSVTENAEIYYTLDGTEPTSSSQLYSSPIDITADAILKAIAIKNNISSEISTANYVIDATLKFVNFDCSDPISLGYDSPTVEAQGVNVTNFTKDNVLIATNKGLASTANRFWATVTNKVITKIDYRMYNGSSFKVSVGKGYKIVQIEFGGNSVSESSFEPKTGTASTTNRVWSWIGDENVVNVNIKATIQVDYIRVITKEVEVSDIAEPTFNLENGTYYGSQTVTISSTDENAVIYYTLDGEDPTDESAKYTEPIEIKETSILKAIAVVGDEASDVAYANYIIGSILNSLESWSSMAVGTILEINTSLTAIHHYNQYLYLTDGTNPILVYGTVTNKYENGDVLPAGIRGEKIQYKGLEELKPVDATFLEATKGVGVEPVEGAISTLSADDQNKYVIIKNVTYSENSISDGSNSMVVNNRLGATLPSDANTYNVKGFVAVAEDVVQFYPTVFDFVNTLDSSKLETVSIEVVNGTIEIKGDVEDVEIYTIGGSLISKGSTKVAASTGMYIVKVNGKATKVVVK